MNSLALMKYAVQGMVLAVATCATMAKAGALESGFRQAQDLVRDFKASRSDRFGSGASSADSIPSFDPAWKPEPEITQIAPPPPPPPPSQTELAIRRELSKREAHLTKLSHRKVAWQTALENLENNSGWREELLDWSEESQKAQFGALLASLELLASTAGPLQEALDMHRLNAAMLWSRASGSRDQLNRISALITSAKSSGSTRAARKAAMELEKVYETFVAAMKSEHRLLDFVSKLESTATRTKNAAIYVEAVSELREKHNLMLACEFLKSFAYERAADAGVEALREKLLVGRGRELTQKTGLVQFFIDYGYNTARFYVSWNQVHDILNSLDDKRRAADLLARNIRETTDQANIIRQDLKRLKGASTVDERKAVLRELRLREMREAYFAGDWFSASSGIRAPGNPILGRD